MATFTNVRSTPLPDLDVWHTTNQAALKGIFGGV